MLTYENECILDPLQVEFYEYSMKMGRPSGWFVKFEVYLYHVFGKVPQPVCVWDGLVVFLYANI